jgi:hypothetical protein
MCVQVLTTRNVYNSQLLGDIGNPSVGFIIAINPAVFSGHLAEPGSAAFAAKTTNRDGKDIRARDKFANNNNAAGTAEAT